MPGVAQVWLTHEEIDSLLLACPTRSTNVGNAVWRSLEPKLLAAQGALACPVPRPHARELKKLSTDRDLAQSC